MTVSSALQPTPGAIIVGASSGIGAALAKRLAQAGYRVALLARRTEMLETLCQELNQAHGPNCARAYAHDATHYAEAPALFQTILSDLGQLDVVIYNAGVMPAVALNEYNFAKDRQMVEVNTLGAMAWLNQAAQAFDKLGRGHIVGISSVAGERGRVKSPGYGTSKAALTTYLEALRNRLTRKGVHVLTVKPGFVATDMLKGTGITAGAISPEQAAEDIFQAIRHRRQTIFTPARWGLVALVLRHIPSVIFRRMSF